MASSFPIPPLAMEDFPPEFANTYRPRQLSLNQSGEFEDEAVADINEEVWVIDAKIDHREYIQIGTEDIDSVLTQAASYTDYHSSGYPHIGLLHMEFNGEYFIGTATIIADGRYLLTCAHNVVTYNKNIPGREPMYAKNIWFDLRKNEAFRSKLSSLVKRYKIRDMVVHPKYFDNPCAESGFDLALCWIDVPENDQHLKTITSTGIFPTLAAGVRYFTDKCKVAVVGFPARAQNRKVGGEKWGMAAKVPMEQREKFSGDINKQEDNLIYKFIDTSAGQSGSPMMHIMGQDSDSEYQCEIFGVHTGGCNILKENYATLITHAKLEWIVQWLGSPWKINSKGDQMYLAKT